MEKLKVLIAIDDPDILGKIVYTATSFLDKNTCEIVLINVMETTSAEENYFYSKPEKFIEHESRKDSFYEVEEYLESNGFDYKGFVYKEGDAAKNIIDVAHNENFDLVCIGTHNKTGFQRFIMGSASFKITRHCDKPVLIIKPDYDPKENLDEPYKVIFAANSSEYSDYASKTVGKYLDKSRAVVDVLNVRIPIQEMIPVDVFIYTDYGSIADEANELAEEIVNKATSNISAQGLKVNEKLLLIGDPVSLIVDEAEKRGTDLIVVASHSKSSASDWLVTGVSTKVYEHSKKPVLVIKNG